MGQAERFFEARAKALVKEAIEQEDMSYKELAARLQALGVHSNDRQLSNRINRGKFSLAFALQVLRALGRDVLEVPPCPPKLRKPAGR